jgi:hypothetical protein
MGRFNLFSKLTFLVLLVTFIHCNQLSYAYTEDVIIVSENTYTDGYTFIVGEVQNIGSNYLNYVELVATFYDNNDNVVASDFTFTELEILGPNQKSPFVLNTYPHQNLNIDHYSVTVADTNVVSYFPYSDFRIKGVNTYRDNWYFVQGEIENTGWLTAAWVKLVATFYNSQGTVIFSDFTYADIDPLAPGRSSPFELNTYPREINPASYDIQVESAEYLSLSYLECDVNQDQVVMGTELVVSGYLSPGIGSQDIVLTYSKPDGSYVERNVETDSSGYFEHTGVFNKLGTWSVYSEWIGNIGYISSKSTEIFFEVEAPPTGNIEISIKDSDNNPLGVVQVISTSNPASQTMLESKTDSAGSCVFTYVLVGSYDFEISKLGYITNSFSVVVSEDETSFLNIELDNILYDIVLLVEDSESNLVAGVQVDSVEVPNGQANMTGTTNSAGSLVFENVREGKYRFFFTKDGYEDSYGGATVDPDNLQWRQEIVKIIQLGDIRLLIKDTDNIRISGASVSIISFPEDQNNLTGSTGSTGLCIFSDILAGNYKFKIRKEGYITQIIEGSCIFDEKKEINVILEEVEEEIIPSFEEVEKDSTGGIPSFPLLSVFLGVSILIILQINKKSGSKNTLAPFWMDPIIDNFILTLP